MRDLDQEAPAGLDEVSIPPITDRIVPNRFCLEDAKIRLLSTKDVDIEKIKSDIVLDYEEDIENLSNFIPEHHIPIEHVLRQLSNREES